MSWLVAAALLTSPVDAPAKLRFSPIRVDLGPSAQTGSVTVVNEGTEPESLQLRAMRWEQDGEGNDRYEETADLVFFPRLATVAAGGSQLIRIGLGRPAEREEEACYRLYISQLPGRRPAQGSQVGVLLAFGLPVFVHPARELVRLELSELAVSAGRVGLRVLNKGTAHVRIVKVGISAADGDGREIHLEEIDGRYLLPGAGSRFAASLPPRVCERAATVRVTVATDRQVLRGETGLQEGSCPP